MRVVYVSLFLSLLTVGGCSFVWTDAAIRVSFPVLPDLPDGWGDAGGNWHVCWHDGQKLNEATFPYGTTDGTLPVSTVGDGVVAVVAELRFQRFQRSFLPCGAVGAPGTTVTLRWKDGFLALVLVMLAGNGVSPALVNIDRLASEIAWRLPDDPWRANLSRVVEQLATGEMRGSYLEPVSAANVRVLVPEGTYRSNNALIPPIGTITMGTRTELVFNVVPGRRVVWWKMDGLLELAAFCEDDTRCWTHLRSIAIEQQYSPVCPEPLPP